MERTPSAPRRLPVDVAGRLRALVAVDVPDDDTGQDSVLALIKSQPGNVSLESTLTEIRKLRAVRPWMVGHPARTVVATVPEGRHVVGSANMYANCGGGAPTWRRPASWSTPRSPAGHRPASASR